MMQKTNKNILLLLGSLILLISLYEIAFFFVPQNENKWIKTSLFIGVMTLYILSAFRRKKVKWTKVLTCLIVMQWSLLQIGNLHHFIYFYLLKFTLFSCCILYVGIQIINWVQRDLSLNLKDLLSGFTLFLVGLPVLFKVLHWPWIQITEFLSYFGLFGLGIKYMLQAIKISSKNQTMK